MNIYIIKVLGVLYLSVLTVSCNRVSKKAEVQVNKEEMVEQYRSQYHFSPKENWMNDPNGMFFYEDNYHLFFQYYPDSTVWGPMHWGHAISRDMLDWEELDIALYPDDLGYIFSGSAVVDAKNTSGFSINGEVPIVAIFTYHQPELEEKGSNQYQYQGIAYSLDGGFSWKKYASNPVLKNPGIKDFRDPKVFWDEKREQWVMVLSAFDKSMFYSSKNLKDWTYLSEFGKEFWKPGSVYECPELVEIELKGTDQTKWVLIQSLNPGGLYGGSGTQYFVGDFDGQNFNLDKDFAKQLQKGPQWIDFGRDNYAGVTWSNISKSDGRTLFMAWMSNWAYAQNVPTEKWRSEMTLPRELKLIQNKKGYKLLSMPVKEIENYFTDSFFLTDLKISGNTKLIENNEIDLGTSYLSIELAELKEDKLELRFKNDQGKFIDIGIDNLKKQIYIDRSQSGNVGFSPSFANQLAIAPIENEFDQIKIEFWIDHSSIEVFFQEGEWVFTEKFFMAKPISKLELLTDSNVLLANLTVRKIELSLGR